MQKKLTITIEENIYNDLRLVVGKGKISKFIEKIIKPYVTKDNLRLAYQTMAKDDQREKEACEWEEGLINNDFS
jgi:predicted CopG family antitoxin